VTPVSTSGFERATDPESTKIPLIQLGTDGSNQIVTAAENTKLSTEYPATTLLGLNAAKTILRVQDAQLFLSGNDIDVTSSLGTEAPTISTVDVGKKLITLSGAMTFAHPAGAIVRAKAGGATAPMLIVEESSIGRYRRDEVGAVAPDHEVDVRDRLFQGDEVHGHVLAKGHASTTDRSDVNLQSMKDHIDFLAAQIEEMKWGYTDPYEDLDSSNRVPPGLGGNLPSTPRYYDRAEGSLAGARTAAITVGDGTNSWGDLNGTTQDVLQEAHDALPSGGGRIFLKRGTYTLNSNFLWTNVGTVTLEGEEGTVVEAAAGLIGINTTGIVQIRNLTIQEDSGVHAARTGVSIGGSNPTGLEFTNVVFNDCAFTFGVLIPGVAQFRKVIFSTTSANMDQTPLVYAIDTDSVLSGVWSECWFGHQSYDLSQAAGIDLKYSVTPTQSASLLAFNDCTFFASSTAGSLEFVHLGATISVVQFSRCLFWSLLTPAMVKVTGGTNLKFNECMGTDNISSLLYADSVDYIEIDAYLNSNSAAAALRYPAIDLHGCSSVKISNCEMFSQSLSFPLSCGIKIVADSGAVSDVLIEGNTITAVSDYVTGILFDVNGNDVTNIRINNNLTYKCACGLLFYKTSANSYSNVSILGNQFTDDSTANYQKVGIWGADTVSYSGFNISGNQVFNCNPASTLELATGIYRHGIIFSGSTSKFTVNNNHVDVVGNSGFRTVVSSGIHFANLLQSTVNNNIVNVVYGLTSYGIRLSTDPNFASNNAVSANNISGINATTGSAIGVTAFKLAGSNISNNHIGTISSSPGLAIAIGMFNTSSVVQDSNFVGNVYTGSTASSFMFYFYALTIGRVSITGNTASSTYGVFVFMQGVTTTGTISLVTISGNNTINSQTGDVTLTANGAATAEHVQISGNNFNAFTAATHNVSIDDFTYVSVSSNMMENQNSSVNVIMTGTTKMTVVSNLLRVASGGDNVDLTDSSNDIYLVSQNLLDTNGGSAGNSINTVGSGSTGGTILVGNLTDDTVAKNAADYAAPGAYSTSGPSSVGY
jgi:hypothetical protein